MEHTSSSERIAWLERELAIAKRLSIERRDKLNAQADVVGYFNEIAGLLHGMDFGGLSRDRLLAGMRCISSIVRRANATAEKS